MLTSEVRLTIYSEGERSRWALRSMCTHPDVLWIKLMFHRCLGLHTKCPSLHAAEDEEMGEVGSSGNQGKDRSTLPDVWTPPSSSCRTSVCRSVSSWFDVKLIADNIMVDP